MDDLTLKPRQAGITPAPKAAAPHPSAASKATGRSPAEERQRLADACADFESIFVEQLFKTMRASVPDSRVLGGGRAEEIYTGMLDQQVALDMARGQGSVGLARQMMSRLTLDSISKITAETKED